MHPRDRLIVALDVPDAAAARALVARLGDSVGFYKVGLELLFGGGLELVRELKGEGVHVMTVYPGATDTPMMQTSKAGPELGFTREPASAVADAVIEGIGKDAFEVIRGGEARARMIALNRDDPAALDKRFSDLKPALAEAVRDHSAL